MKLINIDDLLKELKKYKYKQFHIHHTWKPAKSSFNGKNHMAIQESMRNYHVNTNKWSDIAQHITLFPDGKIVTGRNFGKNPASISGWNDKAFMVEMVGNFDEKGKGEVNSLGYDKLEGEQRKSILILIKYFLEEYGQDSIKFHREGPGVTKTCPGTSLNKIELIKEAINLDRKEVVRVEEKKVSISEWAVDAMKWAVENNLTDGSNVKENINLERFITILYRYNNMQK